MLNELNQVVEYIEDHLTDDSSLDVIAEFAGYIGLPLQKGLLLFVRPDIK